MKRNLYVVFGFLFLFFIVNGCKAQNSASQINFGAYPVDYEIAYLNLIGLSKALSINTLFGDNSIKKTSFDEATGVLITVESISGNKNELNVTLLMSMKESGTGNEIDALRAQFQFQPDSKEGKSYVRYYKLINLLTGKTSSEKRSRGGIEDDGKVLGTFFEFMELGWNIYSL